MPKHYGPSPLLLETLRHHISTSRMKFQKAPELLKKAAAVFRSKAGALKARLLILASPRRRMAGVAGAMSHRIHALVPAGGPEKAGLADCGKALVQRGSAPAAADGDIDHSDMALLFLEDEDEEDCFPDWTHSLFDLDDGDGNGGGGRWEEPSVMDIIRRSREVDGLEFNIDDEIDHAADLFIRRFRMQMSRSDV